MVFAMRKADRDRLNYIRDVRKLVSGFVAGITDEQEQTWEQWVALNRIREWRALRDLLTTDASDAFKARALALLFAPRLDWAPFKWKKASGNHVSLWLHREKGTLRLSDLSPRLLKFVVELLVLNAGVALALEVDEVHRTIPQYNPLIIQALAVLPEDSEDAQRLFGLYQLNDSAPFWNMDAASGYNPFERILNEEVPEKWKRLADEKMREIILAEQEGKSVPRQEHEAALDNYVSHIQLGFYGEKFPYSAGLLASQVDFILTVPNTDGRELFDSWRVYPILKLLESDVGNDHKELCHRLARHVVLGNRGDHGAFWIHDQGTRNAAEYMSREFGASDPELRERLDQIIADGDVRDRDEQANARRRAAEADAVAAAMR